MRISPIGLAAACLCALALQAAPTAQLALAQSAPPAPAQPNSDPTYQQLRQVGLGNEAIGVEELVLHRDAGTFTFHSGNLCFLAPVNGKVTGAVFEGNGGFSLVPPIPIETRTLSLLTKEARLEEKYKQLVLRFTDDTYSEIKKAAGAHASNESCKDSLVNDSRNATRHQLHYNLEGRMLQDVLGEQPGGLFVAFIKGDRYGHQLLYFMDPHGVSMEGLQPEEVALMTYGEDKYGVWTAFHYSKEYQTGAASGTQENDVIDIKDQKLDTQIEENAKLNGKATTTFISKTQGLRVVPLSLFPTLRVESVTGQEGQPLAFIQEKKDDDPDFSVILPKALAVGEKYSITTVYDGKGAISNEGSGNYYPIARQDWYPSSGRLDDFSTFDMTFSIPKGMQIVATGAPVSDTTEGKQLISKWHSEQPQTQAGFQFGKFKEQKANIEKLSNFEVDALANQDVPDIMKDLQNSQNLYELQRGHSRIQEQVLGNFDTTGLAKKAMAEAELAVQIYSDYFGPVGFKRLAMTQQTAFNFGQSWPEMIYLPLSYFYDETIRHELGWDDPRGYYTIVAPHEVAHQWWGYTVTFGSYRDYWMEEGFADFSASLYIQAVWKDHPKEFHKFWKDERDLLTESNKEGFRAIDAGPLTLGYRLANTKTGFDIPRLLIYPKGAYVLHMIRMMMWDSKAGDDNFKAMMHDFVKTYAGRSASTEDFKAIVEKYMTRAMDLDGNHRMDWFFNEYVYGTGMPRYEVKSSADRTPDGKTKIVFTLTRTGVPDNWKDLLSVYAHQGDRSGHLATVSAIKPVTHIEAVIASRVDQITINDNDDTLADVKQGVKP